MSAGVAAATSATSGWFARDNEFGRVAAVVPRPTGYFTPSQRLFDFAPCEIDRDALAAKTLRTGQHAPSGSYDEVNWLA